MPPATTSPSPGTKSLGLTGRPYTRLLTVALPTLLANESCTPSRRVSPTPFTTGLSPRARLPRWSAGAVSWPATPPAAPPRALSRSSVGSKPSRVPSRIWAAWARIEVSTSCSASSNPSFTTSRAKVRDSVCISCLAARTTAVRAIAIGADPSSAANPPVKKLATRIAASSTQHHSTDSTMEYFSYSMASAAWSACSARPSAPLDSSCTALRMWWAFSRNASASGPCHSAARSLRDIEVSWPYASRSALRARHSSAFALTWSSSVNGQADPPAMGATTYVQTHSHQPRSGFSTPI